jgi:hypothetical protein
VAYVAVTRARRLLGLAVPASESGSWLISTATPSRLNCDISGCPPGGEIDFNALPSACEVA